MAQLRRDIQDARIIVYTMHEEPWILSKLDSTLIDGFLSKNAKIDEFKKAVDSVLGGKILYRILLQSEGMYRRKIRKRNLNRSVRP